MAANCLCRLRRVISGYWIVAKEFTHQSAVKDITLLTKVVTDLGRSTFTSGCVL